MVDDEVVRYARWISSQANATSSVEQKLLALSRRAAAELRKAECERADLGTRLGLLEACCWRAGLLGKEDGKQLMHGEPQGPAAFSGKTGPGLERAFGAAVQGSHPALSSAEALLQHVQALISRETHDLKESCVLRSRDLEVRLEELRKDIAEKLQQVLSCGREASSGQQQLQPQLDRLREELRWEVSKNQAAARDDVRIVHNEVMSLDARVALLEERRSVPMGSLLGMAHDGRGNMSETEAMGTRSILSADRGYTRRLGTEG
eukprot:TRINITY_DN11865_c0_g1_i1.p1 TRINITY_DN11865_c0_g1~~TRINITY_DN11865_c0_g1_i1.p1  ORF type:complete len:308 (+),score=66.83 TRINITY_DN11865_c0_g1_i1:136-924(+)